MTRATLVRAAMLSWPDDATSTLLTACLAASCTSAGGDGVHQIAPRRAGRWAAANTSAGHPNGVILVNPYHAPFAIQVGEVDIAYDRNLDRSSQGSWRLARHHECRPAYLMSKPARPGSEEVGAGLAAMVLATLTFSWGVILVKLIGLPPAMVACFRVFVGAATLTAFALVRGAPWPARPGAVIAAGLAFGAHQLLYIAAAKLTQIAIVTAVGAMQPLLVAVLSRRTVGERVTPAVLVSAVLAVVGVAVVVGANIDTHNHSWLGDLLAVVNLGAFTAYFLLAKRARAQGASTLTLTAGFLWTSLLIVVPAMAVQELATPTQLDIMLLLVLTLGPGNGHLLVNWAHTRVSAALASLVLALGPLLSSTWAYLILDEPYTWRHALGMLLVILAIDGGRRAEMLPRREPGGTTPPGR